MVDQTVFTVRKASVGRVSAENDEEEKEEEGGGEFCLKRLGERVFMRQTANGEQDPNIANHNHMNHP